eukprot:Nitzschia sp. Nitz4//scaffold145_size56662//38919//41043//NITZ4_006563-RA/size56662-snap-gene-0.93-mRNA-1//-1//CDS//3329536595//8187//frame0
MDKLLHSFKKEYGTCSDTESTSSPSFQSSTGSARRHIRSATLGSFFSPPSLIPTSVQDSSSISHVPLSQRPKYHSFAGDSKTLANLRAHVQWGEQELYSQVPFAAVWGLHTKERCVREAFAMYAVHHTSPESTPAAEVPTLSDQSVLSPLPPNVQPQATELILSELEHADVPERITAAFCVAVLLAATCQFSLGYNTGVMNAPEAVVFPGHSTTEWSLAVAAFAVGGPFGAILGGKLAESRGRRGALLVDCWIFFIGGAWQALASNMVGIILARFWIGMASGFSTVLVPIYLGELAPPRLRGTLGTLTQFACVVGILASNLLAFPLATHHNWRYLFGVTPMLALVQMALSPWLVESPRWLLHRDPKSQEARTILRKLRGLKHGDSKVEHEISNYMVGEAAQSQDETKSSYAILGDMFRSPKTRWLLISSIFLQMAQQFSGINAVFYYSTSFLAGAVDNPLVGTALIGVVNVIATYVALILMDISGRRTLLLWSSGGMFLSCVMMIVSLWGGFSIPLVVGVNTYVSFFEIGLGPIPWLIVAEMFEAKYVAVAMSLCSQWNWGCNVLVGLLFPWMNNLVGPYCFVPFACFLALTFLYCWSWERVVVSKDEATETAMLLEKDGLEKTVEELLGDPAIVQHGHIHTDSGMGCSTEDIFTEMVKRHSRTGSHVAAAPLLETEAV